MENIERIVDTTNEYSLVKEIVRQIKEIGDFKPRIGLVLGSGLNDLINSIDEVFSVSYKDLKGMPVSMAPGHVGKFVFGYLNGVEVCVMQGRVHYYEGYSPIQVVRPIRVMRMLGINTLILTNANGAINLEYKTGDIMLIKDQIIYNVPNPLIGQNIDEFGERFVDTRNLYDESLINKCKEVCKEIGFDIKEGVYLQTSGPSYETKSETKLFRSFGADAVGMSTAIEAISACHMGLKVLGLSCVSAEASDSSLEELSAEAVNLRANEMCKDLSNIIRLLVKRIVEE